MNVLVLCNTYSQILMCINMKKKIFADDNVDIIISDQCGNVKGIPEKLKSLGIFNNIFFKKTKIKANKKTKIKDKILDIKEIVFGNLYFKDIYDNHYDMFLFYNPDIVTHMIFSGIVNKNPAIKCAMFEEGVLSYNNTYDSNIKVELAFAIRKILLRDNLMSKVDTFYCVAPEVYKGTRKCIKVPPIDLEFEHTGEEFSSLFSMSINDKSYKVKYIYFSSVYDFEGEYPIGEIELIKRIFEIVGANNLLVKVHPRDDVQRFIDEGIEIDNNSEFPWEAIQFSMDFRNHIFLTATSGSVLSANLLMKDMPQVHFLYKLCNTKQNSVAQNSIKNIEDLLVELKQVDGLMDKIHITTNLNDILKDTLSTYN